MYFEVLPAKVFRKSPDLDDGILTYSSDLSLAPGQIVEIPLGKKSTVGIVYKKVPEPDFKTKLISRLLYETPLPNYLLKSIIWLSEYYLAPLPQVVSLFLPNNLLTKHKMPSEQIFTSLSTSVIPLNSAQKNALKLIKQTTVSTKLLHGITGSGKTNIYLELAKEAFENNRSTILLVPEIALTSQLVQIFSKTFGKNVVLIHSRQTDKTRRDTWEKILTSKSPMVVIGPRSALFSPLKNLGLIIIDEAHESAYFQDQSPRYHALRLASFIAKTQKITCLLGTATPLIQDFYLAKQKDSLITLDKKAKESASDKIDVKIIDFKEHSNFKKNRYFSDSLLSEISDNLEKGYQTLIYHNRRGSAPLTICENCGWQALCPNCFLPMTLHSDSFRLVCHTCGHAEKVPTTCPNCHHPEIIHKGFGTKLLETELKKLFKTAKIARFDADNDKKTSLDALYNEVKSGDIDIIIGTQTVARGLDLPKLATVGVVQADSGLSLPDFSAEERTFELLTQVLGRVGRGHIKKATAVIQTYQPESPVITSAIKNDYLGFYNYLIRKRQKAHLPPFFYLARVSVVYKTEQTSVKKIRQIYRELKKQDGIYLSAPAPAFHEHTTSGFTWQIILKSTSRKNLIQAIKNLSSYADIRFVIDPPSLL